MAALLREWLVDDVKIQSPCSEFATVRPPPGHHIAQVVHRVHAVEPNHLNVTCAGPCQRLRVWRIAGQEQSANRLRPVY